MISKLTLLHIKTSYSVLYIQSTYLVSFLRQQQSHLPGASLGIFLGSDGYETCFFLTTKWNASAINPSWEKPLIIGLEAWVTTTIHDPAYLLKPDKRCIVVL